MQSDKTIYLRAVLAIISLSFAQLLFSQDKMRVERIRVIPESVPIQNIYVDDENVKWVANDKALYKVEAKDIAKEVPIGGGEVSLLQFPGGNADIRWSKDKMQQLLGAASITAAAFDRGEKILWVGTNGYGVFKFKTDPELRLLEQLHIDNSKLRSDFINTVFVGNKGKVWIGTGDGAVSIVGSQWSPHQKFFNILRIRGRGNELWAIGDDLVWVIDNKENWTPIEINRRQIEGEIHDIAVDKEGRIWIASNIMTSYRIASDYYQRFGPGQYFTSQFVNYVSVDDDGTIWVGTNDKGLYIIEKESTITVTSTIDKYLDCNGGGENAEVSVRAIGGKPPYTFIWSGGEMGDHVSQLGAGTYQLTVTDTEGSSKTASVEIPDPFLTLTAKMDSPESGPGKEDGAASVSVTGGVKPYQYEWFSGVGEAVQYGLPEGEYGITVTDAAGCTAITTAVVSQVAQPLSVSLEQKAFIRCPGESAAVLVATQGGGKAPFSYAWSNGGDNTAVRESLKAGKYQVTVTDSQGASATASITVEEPTPVSVSLRIDSPASANVNNGVATAEVSGGKAPYQYNWDNGETTVTAGKLAPRRHTITVTDASGCSGEAAVDISENILPLKGTLTQTKEILCAGDAGAALQVSIDGGKSPFTYRWNSTAVIGEAPINLSAGDYAVTVTDAAGSSFTSSVTIRAPKPIALTTQAEAPAMSGKNEGHAIVRAEGGTGKLSYLWDNGDTGQKTSSLSAGLHKVTVTDEAGCAAIGEVSIVEDFMALTVNLETRADIRCAGNATGALHTAVSGGKEPYTLQWNQSIPENTPDPAGLTAGTYTLLVTDALGNSARKEVTLSEPDAVTARAEVTTPASANGADGVARAEGKGGKAPYQYHWSNGASTIEARGLAAGKYDVTVTDANGCEASASIEVTENILALQVRLEQSAEVACNGGTTAAIEAVVSGGKSPFTYQWGDAVSTQKRSDLGAGEYSLVVTDAAGNTAVQRITISEPALLTARSEVIHAASANTADGAAKILASGGTEPYTYKWSNGASTAEVTTLPAGNYKITVTDAGGCTAVADVGITEDIIALKVALRQEGQISCTGGSGVNLQAEITGGKTPFIISWSDGESGQSRTNVQAGAYGISVTDAAGQNASAEVVVAEPDALEGEIIDVRSATHERIRDGKATARLTGGTLPYSFTWDNGEKDARAMELAVGPHSVTATDARGCSIALSTEIKEKILPELTTSNLEKGEAVRMEKLQFEADSASIDAASIPTLQELYEFLYDNPTIVVEIGGHTNGLPDDEYCDRLSSARAKAVADYIIDMGVDAKRILYKGYGKRQPIATNMTPEGRRKNQRVEVKIVKLNE